MMLSSSLPLAFAHRNALFYKFRARSLPYFANFLSPQRLILHISRPPIALFCKFSFAATPYFTNFAPTHCLILQVFVRQNALFYIFRASSLPYFTSFRPSERLILHISRSLIALFYKFSNKKTVPVLGGNRWDRGRKKVFRRVLMGIGRKEMAGLC